MSFPRLLMVVGMTLPLIGLIYAMSRRDDPKGMTVELTLLAAGALIFISARQFEKKHSA